MFFRKFWMTRPHLNQNRQLSKGEREESMHPEHQAFERVGGELKVAIPMKASWLLQWKRERACKKSGGHWWHRDGFEKFCCQCGAVSRLSQQGRLQG